MRFAPFAATLVLMAGCGDSKKKDSGTTPPPPPVAQAINAGPVVQSVPPPLTGTHLDGADTAYQPRNVRAAKSEGKSIELVLRSTPPGAVASIDGVAIGKTPTFWSGPKDHNNHVFTFVKSGYAMARYRFVSTQSGVVHGSLQRLVPGDLDAGL